MPTLFFKTADGTPGRVRDVPATAGALQQARWALRVHHYIEITEAEYLRLKAEIDKKEGKTK